jgi:hypothetical protein
MNPRTRLRTPFRSSRRSARPLVLLLAWCLASAVVLAQGPGAPTNVVITAKPALPSITSLNPTSGPVGTSVTISGSGFGAIQGGSAVTFGGVTASATSWSALSITVTVPATAATGPVLVSANGLVSAGVTFTVTGGASGNGCTVSESLCRWIAPSGGNDANPGTEALPWATAAKGFTTCTAGMQCIYRGGTFATSTHLTPNSGTNATTGRVTHKAYPGEVPVFDRGLTTRGTQRPVVRINSNQDFLTFTGLTLKRGDGAGLEIGLDSSASNDIVFEDGVIREIVTNDNSAAIWVNGRGDSGAGTLTFRRNDLCCRTVSGSPTSNGSGIIVFKWRGTIFFENNDVHDLHAGFYYKHTETQPNGVGTVFARYNRWWNFTAGAGGGGDAFFWTHHHSFIQYNLIVDTGSGDVFVGVQVWDGGTNCPDTFSESNTISHNTVWNAVGPSFSVERDASCFTVQQGNVFADNIAVGFTSSSQPGYKIWGDSSICPGQPPGFDDSQTTIHHSLGFSATIAHDARVCNVTYNLNALPTSILDRTGNLTAAPTFLDAVGSGINDLDLRLAVGSAGKGAASDGEDMGAYTSTVQCIGNPNASPKPVGCP